jgi:hypothetical protein
VGASVDDDPAAFTLPPLTVLHERISPAATRHGVTIECGEDPPAALAGADLAIVGAHGGLVPGEGHFQVISNDRTQRWSGERVSYRLRGIGILVLFVCSAGRIETYRRYRTSGFVKRLLASGCRAIVASPWPVSVTAAAHWLPTFLDTLASGQTVGPAAHEANRHVLDSLGGDAAEGLAMHVFGDPLQR